MPILLFMGSFQLVHYYPEDFTLIDRVIFLLACQVPKLLLEEFFIHTLSYYSGEAVKLN